MKILFVDFKIPYALSDADYPCGGTAIEWLSWIEGFKKNNISVDILTWKGAKQIISRKDVKIIESYDPNKGIKVLKFLFYRIPTLFAGVKKSTAKVVIQEGSGQLTGLMAIFAKLLRKKFIYRAASDKDADIRVKIKLGWSDYLLYQIGLKLSDCIITQNSYQERKFKKIFPKKKVFKIYNPYILPVKQNSNRRFGSDYVGWIGNFRLEKNIKSLFEIIEELPHINFKLVGKLAKNADNVSKLYYNKLKEKENVEMVGYLKRDDIIVFLRNAKLLLNTSLLEGFSNTYLEAWAENTPVVCHDNVNPDNLINKFNLGFSSDTFEGIPKLINKVFNETYKMNCREYVAIHHSPQFLAKNFSEIIKELN